MAPNAAPRSYLSVREGLLQCVFQREDPLEDSDAYWGEEVTREAEVPDGPRPLWLLNVCRTSCGFCQRLAPTWELLAERLARLAGVAYWDADSLPELPPELGDVRATPAVFALVPPAAAAPNASARRWTAVAYAGSLDVDSLSGFAAAYMPTRTRQLHDDDAWASFARLAAQRSVPRAVAFFNRSRAAQTPPILSALSSAYADSLLFGEVRLHGQAEGDAPFEWARSSAVLDSLPALVVLPPSGRPQVCESWAPPRVAACLTAVGGSMAPSWSSGAWGRLGTPQPDIVSS
ncbi:hypothetical protein EMIHUDRAFT_95416 [Emiliania huxleyi CCMP1516]|uniref:Thioredoxin domain-containing protein n=2 Tax=Emiliania huxleyi TaxID=2903 RepID=A0A0D3JGZ9_EMIH1|nr:hypothetical protein EMIHUDRAFT_95416 [Emiliania huxleyi CCMP1516]EOD22784.1 hypothetical protein EMIHUDRAFT_95416 [Emiliania huxleyi CCMP1516]|eukprot:XP_005775213.1 hypothetical protein EMIHUDRAFT_95416 [Emiliania huxleyi CCMP1516]